MEIKKRLEELMNEVAKLVPTMMFVGTSEENKLAFLMASPVEATGDRMIDICKTLSNAMEQHQIFREVMFTVVCWYMQQDPKYKEGMVQAIDMMKKLDNAHKRAAGGK